MATTGSGGDAAGDQLSLIENLVGSAFNDALIGSEIVNRLDGGAGNDQLRGSAGADVLVGGAGAERGHTVVHLEVIRDVTLRSVRHDLGHVDLMVLGERPQQVAR